MRKLLPLLLILAASGAAWSGVHGVRTGNLVALLVATVLCAALAAKCYAAFRRTRWGR